MSNTDSPTKRILFVLELLYENGPMSLAEVARKCSFSRAAVWRALNTLRDTGWVRMRLGDNAFVLLPDKSKPASNIRMHFPNTEQLVSLMHQLEKEYAVHVLLAGVDGFCIQILESTNKEDYKTTDLSLVHSAVAIAAQALIARTNLVRLLREYLTRCPLSERRWIEDGHHAKRLRDVQMRGYFTSNDGSEVAVPLRLEGQVLALHFRSKTESQLMISPLIAHVNSLDSSVT